MSQGKGSALSQVMNRRYRLGWQIPITYKVIGVEVRNLGGLPLVVIFKGARGKAKQGLVGILNSNPYLNVQTLGVITGIIL